MKTSNFYYQLPAEYIAQTPVEPRDASRLMVLNRRSKSIHHAAFREIGDYLQPNDLLVLNETRVIPARLYAFKEPGGGRFELLLLNKRDTLTWEVLVGGKGLHVGRQVRIEQGPDAEITKVLNGPRRLVSFADPIESYLETAGHVPLPPYIKTPLEDPERYQTIYARENGSAAAPTAGLHFTERLMAELAEQGVKFASVVLHVGLDTFAPVEEDDPRQHVIHTEWCQLGEKAAREINDTRGSGGRVIAVGTTSVRTIESAAIQSGFRGELSPYEGRTDLYILPGYRFKLVDAMVTNFHLPRSTLIMLVSAFAGRETILEAYQAAVEEHYRFYSFGDAMLIL